MPGGRGGHPAPAPAAGRPPPGRPAPGGADARRGGGERGGYRGESEGGEAITAPRGKESNTPEAPAVAIPERSGAEGEGEAKPAPR